MKKTAFAWIIVWCFVCCLSYSVQAQFPYSSNSLHFFSDQSTHDARILMGGQPLFLPDGPYCPSQCFEDSIVIAGYPPDLIAGITTTLTEICINIEHSYAGDLGFILSCPTGQMVVLDPNTHSGGAFLGVPLGGAGHHSYDGTDNCDPLDNPPGTGWTYCWSDSYPSQGTMETLSYIGGTIPPTDMLNHEDYIMPGISLSALNGCPMNGTWKIRICDDYGSDNGWSFGWGLTFDGPPNITGTVYADLNKNGIRDSTEGGLAGRIVKMEPGPYYHMTDSNGFYGFFADTGYHEVTLVNWPYWSCTSDSSTFHVHIFDTATTVSDLDFGTAVTDSVNDVAVYITGSSPHAGHTEYQYLDYYNWGAFTQQGTILLNVDTLLNVVSTNIPPDSTSGSFFMWHYTNLIPQEHRQIWVTVQMPGVSYIGASLVSDCRIEPFAGDSNIYNNVDCLGQRIIAPVDPNYKEVNPSGKGSEGFVPMDQMLSYTIHFQNTGTDTARSVWVVDSISPILDPETIMLISYSHPPVLEMDGNTVLTFRFDNIMLPDSGIDEAGSQGYVRFSIAPYPGLPEQTEVNNHAYIFFDSNPYVLTNNVLNTFQTDVTEITEDVSDTHGSVVVPNPFSETSMLILSKPVSNAHLQLFDATGRLVRSNEHLSGKEIPIKRGTLSPGLYFLLLDESSEIVVCSKFIIR